MIFVTKHTCTCVGISDKNVNFRQGCDLSPTKYIIFIAKLDLRFDKKGGEILSITLRNTKKGVFFQLKILDLAIC
jgi:hypothetical protein